MLLTNIILPILDPATVLHGKELFVTPCWLKNMKSWRSMSRILTNCFNQAYLVHVPIIHPCVFLQGFKVHRHILVNHFHNLQTNIQEMDDGWYSNFWIYMRDSPRERFSKCILGRMLHLGRAVYRSPWRMKVLRYWSGEANWKNTWSFSCRLVSLLAYLSTARLPFKTESRIREAII